MWIGRNRLLQDRVGALGRRRQVGDQHEREGHRVDREAQGVHARPHVREQEGEHDRPGQEGRAVVEAHDREVAGLGPALREARRVEREAGEGRGHGQRT